jgi:Uma2 family endonuclease
MVLQLHPVRAMSDDEFFEFATLNGDLRLERTARGDIIIMTPTGGATGHRNIEIAAQLHLWAKRDGTGLAFDSSTMFILPDTAVLSPDAAWLKKSRWEALTPEDREKFVPLCPDFVLKLRSPSDRLKNLQDKLEEYVANGAQLGWLIDPKARRVYVYRPGEPVEILDNPESVSGEPVLRGFGLDLSEVW